MYNLSTRILLILTIVVAANSLALTQTTPARQTNYPAPVEGNYTIKDFRFRSGETLPELKLQYLTIGTPVKDNSGVVRNAVLIMHGTGGTGSQFLSPQFANVLFGPGQPLDATKYFIILPDAIGHGRSSKPSNGLHLKFPHYTYDDMVLAQYRLITEKLGVSHLRLVMGTSMGGMHTWVWGETYPDFMDALMPLASMPIEIAGRNRIMRKMIMDAIRNDPDWQDQLAAQATITDFTVALGGSPYLNINTTYHDSAGTPLTNSLLWGSNIDDAYSHGTNLTQADVASIVSGSILSEQMPHDPQGIYIVIGSDDINLAGHCTDFCEFHHFVDVFGVRVQYAFIGNPRRCPSKCAAQLTGPNGDYAVDAMINWIAHDIAGVLTSPALTGWYDRLGKENSDKCLNRFGTLYQTPNGGLANVKLAGRDYLLQMNWVNNGTGYCALSYP